MSTVGRRIESVENGLLELGSDSRGTARARRRMALSERMAHHKVPGVSAAIINGDQIEWAKGYGVIKAGSDSPVSTESLFQAASTTKLLTAVLALRLVERGQLSLDEDVNRYLVSWRVPENEFTRKRKVTLRLLLTHQAGLPAGGFDCEEGTIPSIAQVLMGQSPAQNQAAVVEFVPGTRSQYSNLGYVVVQLLIEDLLGRPLARAAQEILFQPLGMRSSTLEYPLEPELAAREAMPHDAEGQSHEPAMHPTAVAQGGLVTTPCDLAQFAIELMRAYRGQSDRLLSREMVRRMFNPELDLDPAMFFFPIKGGLGALLRERGQHFSFLHPGANLPGATCWLEGCPASGKGAVIMTNGAMGLVLSLEMLSAIADEYGWPDAE